MPVVLVTTGATAPFEKLIENVLHPDVLIALTRAGYDRLLVQYGWGKDIFEHHLGSSPGLTISGFDFVEDMANTMSQVDLVISHAGTGSILDALRVGSKLIVVVNERLMENHQLEIAKELAKGSHLIYTGPVYDELVTAIGSVSSFRFVPLPEPNSAKVASIIDHEAGL